MTQHNHALLYFRTMAIFRFVFTLLLVISDCVPTFENLMFRQKSSPRRFEESGTVGNTPVTGKPVNYTHPICSTTSNETQNGTNDREIKKGLCLEIYVNTTGVSTPHSLSEQAEYTPEEHHMTFVKPFVPTKLNYSSRGMNLDIHDQGNFSEVFTSLNLKMTTESHQNVTDVSTSKVIIPSKRLRQSEERTGATPRSASVTATMTSTDSMTGRYAEANTVIGSGLTTDMMSADRTEELSIAELDTILTYTCKDRCGQDMPFPCSCAAICVVYNTCCENITLDCPHIVQEGLARFYHLVNTVKVCSEKSVYIIASCPEQEDDNIMLDKSDLSGILDSEKQGMAESKRNDRWKDEQMKNVQDQNTTPPPGLSDKGEKTGTTLADRLHAAFLSVPVTDRHTGFTFMDKTIYDCHNMPESSALPWSIYLGYELINPKRLEDLITKNSRLDQFTPPFSTHILRPHQCIKDVIASCSHAWSFQVDDYSQDSIETVSKKCRKVSAVVNFKMRFYQNRYCFYCNGGLLDKYEQKYSRLYIGGSPLRNDGFQVLMSTDRLGEFSLRLNMPAHQVRWVALPWERASCSLPSSASKSSKTVGSTCSATCRVPFTLGSDGRCRAPHTSLVALVADHLPPLCDRALSGLARFIECGLKTTVEPLKDADFHQPSGTVHFSSSLNKTLYVVKLNLALPVHSKSIYSNELGYGLPNIPHLAFLVKSLYQPGLFEDVCNKQDLESAQDKSGEICTNEVNVNGSTIEGYDQQDVERTMSKLRGPIIDRQNTKLVCISSHDDNNINEVDGRALYCMDDPVHQGDEEAIRKVRSSPCFDHLLNLRFQPNGAEHLNLRDLWTDRLVILTALSVLQISGFYFWQN